MKAIGILSAVLVGTGLCVTSANAGDLYGYGPGHRTIIHEEIDDVRPPGYGYRGIGFGDVDLAPRPHARRVIREIYEYEDGDLDE